MKIDLFQECAVIVYGNGCCIATRRMLRVRAVELAVIDGRAPQEVSKTDWEQAKRELSDGAERHPNGVIAATG
ncbi:MAG: hypothetical protein ABI600_15145 [Luteolibacter sp.]